MAIVARLTISVAKSNHGASKNLSRFSRSYEKYGNINHVLAAVSFIKR